MQKEWYVYIKSRLSRDWRLRLILMACVALTAYMGALYLYFAGPQNIRIPCLFHLVTGLYCPGCGAGRACYSILHGEFLKAFCYNPLMTVLLPLIGIYTAARAVDWIVTGENHIDRKINVKFLTWVLVIVVVYGVLRNIPVFPFTLLAPEGLWQIL